MQMYFNKTDGLLTTFPLQKSCVGHLIVLFLLTIVGLQGDEFRVWILKKLFQGEQACHRSPSFAKLHVSATLCLKFLMLV